MCRFVVYHGASDILMSDLLEKPENSLISQSKAAREGLHGVNADGVGVAWYNQSIDQEPGVYKSTHPAWGDDNLKHLGRKISSDCFVAHVRASTVGDVTKSNCHPFSFDKFAFVHNGTIRQFKELKRALTDEIADFLFTEIRGQTDSEHLFYLILHFYYKDDKQDLEHAVIQAFDWVVSQQRHFDSSHFCRLNICITDGHTTIVTRFSSKGEDTLSLHAATMCFDVNFIDDGSPESEARKASIIASEPLTDVIKEWIPIPENHYAILKAKQKMTVNPLPDF